uniref:Uncharacterized protein n=1 Tax=uncultured bacterium A1Q1_fos_1877 TaxID=1256555 RepID=L7VWT7_9BACT|nr:hypothetical protein [uncultured bacterium A1Q1_fos_1877]
MPYGIEQNISNVIRFRGSATIPAIKRKLQHHDSNPVER